VKNCPPRRLPSGLRLPAIVVLLAFLAAPAAESAPPSRTPWTRGTVTGAPDPPPAYKTAVRYPHLKFDQPLLVRTDPANTRIWICQRNGQVFSFSDNRSVTEADPFVDLRSSFDSLTPHPSAKTVGSVYGLVFHPAYPDIPYCWMTYTLVGSGRGQHLEDGTRLSRFRVMFDQDGVPRCDAASERVLLSWLEGGHNGACLEFGPDGMLYVSTGDGEVPNPPDPRKAGQDVSNLLSTILRIHVSVADDGPAYDVPPDNPFVSLPEARPEIWAYGFRNPWKMTFAPDGSLWVGDVGWELFEMVYRVERAGNYGWSIMEGPQPVHPDGKRGPTPIQPPALALRHADAASVTGGYVYRGQSFPELRGKYIFGDYETRRIWSTTPQASVLKDLTDLVEPAVRIVAFGEDTRGELLLLDFDDGTIHELLPNEALPTGRPFPRRLSETGVFADTPRLHPAPGVHTFQINAPLWEDGATAVRHVAVPGHLPVIAQPQQKRRTIGMLREWMTFPNDSVLTRTVTLRDDEGRDVRLETQLLHFDQNHWRGYSYVWNTEQDDAILADADGVTLSLSEYGRFADRDSWQIAARSECLRCHNPWAGGALAFTIPQLDRVSDIHGSNQLSRFLDLRLLEGQPVEQPDQRKAPTLAALADPYDTSLALDDRARSYLSVNCSHCHQNGAGGTATIDLRHSIALDKTQLVAAEPRQGTFSLVKPQLVVPGEPSRSVLMYRMSCTGRGRMPHIGSAFVDVAGVKLIRDWIRELASENPAKPSSLLSEPVIITDSTVALDLVEQLDREQLRDDQVETILAATREAPIEIAALFARFQPPEFRQSMNQTFDRDAVLKLAGDPEQGRMIFGSERLQCSTCHRSGGKGGDLGPPLEDMARRMSAAELLDSVLEPSRRIDPKYTVWTAVTIDGAIHTGLLAVRSDHSVTLKNAKAERITLDRRQIEEFRPQTVSIMPDRLLVGLEPQEIADLLAFLSQQRQ
jgi:putative heme-binding domain-containing protein